MFNIYVRHGMVVGKIHEKLSFKQSKRLEKYILQTQKNIYPKTLKRKLAENDSEKDLYKLLNIALYGQTLEIVRNQIKIDFFKKR